MSYPFGISTMFLVFTQTILHARFIGVVENEGNIYFFATNIEGDKNAYGGKAREITLKILKEMGILK
jgi:beta-lactamase class D